MEKIKYLVILVLVATLLSLNSVFAQLATDFPTSGSYNCKGQPSSSSADWKLPPAQYPGVQVKTACDANSQTCSRVICRNLTYNLGTCGSKPCQVQATAGLAASQSLFTLAPDAGSVLQTTTLGPQSSTYATFQDVNIPNVFYTASTSKLEIIGTASPSTIGGLIADTGSSVSLNNVNVGSSGAVLQLGSTTTFTKTSVSGDTIVQDAASLTASRSNLANLIVKDGTTTKLTSTPVSSLQLVSNEDGTKTVIKNFMSGSQGSVAPSFNAQQAVGTNQQTAIRRKGITFNTDGAVNTLNIVTAGNSENYILSSNIQQLTAGTTSSNYITNDVTLQTLKITDSAQVHSVDRSSAPVALATGEVQIPSTSQTPSLAGGLPTTYSTINNLVVDSNARNTLIDGSIQMGTVSFGSSSASISRSYPIYVARKYRTITEPTAIPHAAIAIVRVKDSTGRIVSGCDDATAHPASGVNNPTCYTTSAGLITTSPITFTQATASNSYKLEVVFDDGTVYTRSLNLGDSTAPLLKILLDVPNTPTNVQVNVPQDNTQTDALSLSWKNNDNLGIVSKWYISYTVGGVTQQKQIPNTASFGNTITQPVTITNAQPDTKVDICVTAWGQSGSIPTSQGGCVYADNVNTLLTPTFANGQWVTDPIYTRALNPQNVGVTPTSTSMKVAWDNHDATRTNPLGVKYTVNLYDCNGLTVGSQTVVDDGQPTQKSYTFNTLIPNTCYKGGVTSLNEDQIKSLENTAQKFTLSVSSVAIDATTTDSSAQVSWDNGGTGTVPGNPDGTLYDLYRLSTIRQQLPTGGYLYQTDPTNKETQLDKETQQLSYNVPGLACDSFYSWDVRSKNNDGVQSNPTVMTLGRFTLATIGEPSSPLAGQTFSAGRTFNATLTACADQLYYKIDRLPNTQIASANDGLPLSMCSTTDCTNGGQTTGCWLYPDSNLNGNNNWKIYCNIQNSNTSTGDWNLHLAGSNGNSVITSTRHLGPFHIDATLPTTIITSPSATEVTNNYYSNPITIKMQDSDNNQLASCSYSINAGLDQSRQCNQPLSISAGTGGSCPVDGFRACVILLKVTDSVGNNGSTSATLNIDTTVPTSSDTASTQIPNQWSASNPSVQLSCADNAPVPIPQTPVQFLPTGTAAGCAEIRYCTVDLNRQGSSATCDPLGSGSTKIDLTPSSGNHGTAVFNCQANQHCQMKMYYLSRDKAIAPNVESVKSLGINYPVKIDMFAPAGQMDRLYSESNTTDATGNPVLRLHAKAVTMVDNDPDGYTGSGLSSTTPYTFAITESGVPTTHAQTGTEYIEQTTSDLSVDGNVKYTDAVGNIGIVSDTLHHITGSIPVDPAFTGNTPSSISVKVNAGTSTVSTIQYAIFTDAKCSGGVTCPLDASGNILPSGSNPTWQSALAWNGVSGNGVTVGSLLPLTPNTQYHFQVISKNSAGAQTPGNILGKFTLANIPGAILGSGPSVDSSTQNNVISWTSNSNPSTTVYTIQRRPDCNDQIPGSCDTWTTVKTTTSTSITDQAPGSSDSNYQYNVYATNGENIDTIGIVGITNRVSFTWTLTTTSDFQAGVNTPRLTPTPIGTGEGVAQTGFYGPNLQTCSSGDCGDGALKLTSCPLVGGCSGVAYYTLSPGFQQRSARTDVLYNSFAMDGGNVTATCAVVNTLNGFQTLSNFQDCSTLLSNSTTQPRGDTIVVKFAFSGVNSIVRSMTIGYTDKSQ